MATLAVQVVTEEIEKITTENGICETRSETVTETLVALSSENAQADSGILTCTNSSDGRKEESAASNSQPAEECLTGKSSTDANDHSSQEQNKLSLDSRCSQESKASSCTTKSSFSSVSKRSESASSKYTNENSNSSHTSTLKGSQKVDNEGEDSRSSISSSASTIKTSHPATYRSDDDSNSRSSSKSSSRRSSPEKQSENEGDSKRSQSVHADLTEDNDSRSSVTSSNSRSITKNRQPVIDKSDESNSRSSFKSSSKRSSPEKQSENEGDSKRSQSVHTDLTEDNDSRSSVTSSNSRPSNKTSQPLIDKSDDESNSRSSFKSSSKKSSPVKQKENQESQKKKYFSIVDSDSEDEIVVPQKSKDFEKNNDSDSSASKSSQSSKSAKKSKIKNKRKLIDSDSDEESTKADKKQSDSAESGSDSDKEESKSANKSNKISNLVDSDSESGSDNRSVHGGNASSGEENDKGKSKKERKKSEKKRTGTARASKDAAMQQIHSETQRLMRESHISLPYHRPKQRTLQEFLNRKKITSDIPKNLTCAEKVKMFPEMISKVVKEKEEEAEMFYKSSDSEEDQEEPMEVDQAAAKNEIQNGNESSASTAINIADTQKLTHDDIQESHNKISVLQQRSIDFGVPRKLFLEDEQGQTENVQASQECPNTEETMDSDNMAAVHKKPREVKTGLRESSIPRKLFSGDTEEMDMDVDTNDTDVSMSEDKIEETPKAPEITETMTEPSENKSALENSAEDIVLNISETEQDIDDETLTESSKISDLAAQNKDPESIMISETPFISSKELAKSNRASLVPPNDPTATENSENKENESTNTEEPKDSEDLILKLAPETPDDEIIDRAVLRDDFYLPPELDEPVKKPSIKEQILANALKNKPTIKASPGSMIDFTSNGQMKEGASRLLDRFVRHSVVHKPNVEEVAEVKVMRTEGTGDDARIVEEVLPFTRTIVEEDPKRERKPGEKLQKLREDLKRRIANARTEEWRQREENEREDEEEEEDGGKGKGDDFYEGLPDEEELLEDEESGESEPEEEDVVIKESRRKTCEFGDEEAEVSEDEIAEDGGGNEEEEEEEKDEEEEEEEEEEETEKEEEISTEPRKLKRIIRPVDDDDDDDDESKSSLMNDAVASAQPKLSVVGGGARQRTKTDEDMFASQTSNDGAGSDSMPPYQSRERCDSDARSQACKTPLPKICHNNLLSMISPVTQLTALNTSLGSGKKSASKTNNFNFGLIDASISVENTPTENSANRPQTTCNMEKIIGLQKKLFEDPPESVNDDELLAICSGRFDTQESPVPPHDPRNGVTDSQLMDLCSGAFVTQPVDMKKLEATAEDAGPSKPELGDETSQDITLTLDDDDENSKDSPAASSVKRSDESMFSGDSKSPVKLSTLAGPGGSKNPMEAWLRRASEKQTQPSQAQRPKVDPVTDTQLMDLCSGAFTSQPIDLKELEKNDAPRVQAHNEASQDFDLALDENTKSPVKQMLPSQKPKEPESSKQKVIDLDKDPNAPRKTYAIVSSSDDEADGKTKPERPKKKVLKKKKVQKLALSDDEDDEDKARNEFSDLEESELDDYEEEEEEKFVDYDSEENEVVVVPKGEIKKVAAKFLENEAELSESDWDSADEDEQDMDKLEFEEADAEDIDEDKMKDQLDKMHMKQVMDEDQREVRLLQELLFDDGDLHSEGAGRERKFKWKNIDSLGDDELGPRTDENADAIDDEVDTTVELQMRKMRYEQQKFLEETEKSLDVAIDQDFNESQLFKRGLKVVSVRSSSKTTIEEQKLTKSNSVGTRNLLMSNGVSSITKKTLTSTKSLSFSNMKGSFLARGDETLIRIAQNLPEKSKINPGRNRKFVFEHLSPTVSNAPKQNSEQENDNTPAKDKNRDRKRKMFASQSSSQTPRSTKKLKVDDRTTGKKLF